MAFFMCSFHHQDSRHQQWGRVLPQISLLVLSRPVLMLFQISSVAASATPADSLTCENFKARDEHALEFCWHINPFVAYKKMMLQGYFLVRDQFYTCDKLAHGPTEKNEKNGKRKVQGVPQSQTAALPRSLSAWLHLRDEMVVTFLKTCNPKTQVES